MFISHMSQGTTVMDRAAPCQTDHPLIPQGNTTRNRNQKSIYTIINSDLWPFSIIHLNASQTQTFGKLKILLLSNSWSKSNRHYEIFRLEKKSKSGGQSV